LRIVAARRIAAPMRTTSDHDSVRLYHLDADSGTTATLMYGPLPDALAMAAAQPVELQPNLFLQTNNDVIAYHDLVGDPGD
jgi:hypothetical protein